LSDNQRYLRKKERKRGAIAAVQVEHVGAAYVRCQADPIGSTKGKSPTRKGKKKRKEGKEKKKRHYIVVWLGCSARKEKNKEKEGSDLVCFYVTICFHVWYMFLNDRKEGSGKLFGTTFVASGDGLGLYNFCVSAENK
jgi:hypothetical protein